MLLQEWQETSLLEPPRVAAQNLDLKVGSQLDPIANSNLRGLPVSCYVSRIDDRLPVPLVDQPAFEPLGVFGRSATEEPLAGRGAQRLHESAWIEGPEIAFEIDPIDREGRTTLDSVGHIRELAFLVDVHLGRDPSRHEAFDGQSIAQAVEIPQNLTLDQTVSVVEPRPQPSDRVS